MEIEIEIKRKNMIILFVAVIFVFSIGFTLAFYSGLSPNIFGHQSNSVDVTIAGNTVTLQKAINDRFILSTLSSSSSLDIGIVPLNPGFKDIGKDRNCVGFVQNYYRSNCKITVECIYNKNTGIASGSVDFSNINCGYAICGYICKSGVS